MHDILVRTTIATAVAILGGVLGVLIGRASQRFGALVNAAAGALLAVTLISLLPEAAEFIALPELILAVASGYAVFFLVGKYVSPLCPACAAGHIDAHTPVHFGRMTVLLVIALTLHSLMDGVAVAAGHGLHHGSDMSLLFAVSFHKLPEGLALAALLLGAGYTPRTALLWTIGIEMTTQVGGLLGIFALRNVPAFYLGATLAHVGGGFLYLVLHPLLGRSVARGKASQIGYGTLGFASVALLLWSLNRLSH